VNGFFSKVARFAVSKMAAFCYAVAVGVAGNLVFHYVQTHEAVPSVAATHREAPPLEDKPPAVAPAAAVIAKPSAPPPAVPAKPVALAEPATVNLPTPAAMSAPPLKPAALPSSAAPVEAAVHPAVPPSSPSNPTAALPPLGPAIEVAVPPASPAAAMASAPISLLPETKSAPAEIADKPPGSAKPGAPGPGSGGLY
jgi:hypothetical protein